MTASAGFFWSRLTRHLWFFPTLWSVLAVCAFVFATLINEVVPGYWMPDVGEETLNGMLKVIASTMLGISTFSLSILYSAFTFASSNATARATELIIDDTRAHEAISSFIAAFIFSQVVNTAMGYYGPSERVVLLLETIGVPALVVFALLR